MKQDNNINSRIDRGWGRMENILAKELPVKEEKDRKLIFWLLLAGLAIAVITVRILTTEYINSTPVKENDAQENLVLRNSVDPLELNADKKFSAVVDNNSSANEVSEDKDKSLKVSALTSNQALTKQKPIPAKPIETADLQLFSPQQKQFQNQVAGKNNSASSEIKDEHLPGSNIAESASISGSKKTDIPNNVFRHDILSLESIPKLPLLQITKQEERITLHYLPVLPTDVHMKKRLPMTFGISAHGILASGINYKGWNAGIHLGYQPQSINYSVYLKAGNLHRNVNNITFDIEVSEPAENDLTSGMEFDTMVTQQMISESLKIITTGFEISAPIAKHFYLSPSIGIDYYFNSRSNEDVRNAISPGLGVIETINNESALIGINKRTSPFVQLGMLYAIHDKLFFEFNYKRQMDRLFETREKTLAMHQFSLGTKYIF